MSDEPSATPAPEDQQILSLDSLRSAVRVFSKDKTQGVFYPHVYWWDLERYLKLVRGGAIFNIQTDEIGRKILVWDLPSTNEHLSDHTLRSVLSGVDSPKDI